MNIPFLNNIGICFARYLSKPRETESRVSTCKPELLEAALKKGDILLTEGTSRFSTAIKFLSQSTWSHAILFVGDALGAPSAGKEACVLVEADVVEGVRAVPLSMYSDFHIRICRPVGISSEEIDDVVNYVVKRIGHKYDLKNLVDLCRYFIQTPFVPNRWKRRMIALGSGEPTKALCSTLIAQAFQSIKYPILPEVVFEKLRNEAGIECYHEVLAIRHHSLFTPRDFDVSPYFRIVKPTIEEEFDHHNLIWKKK